MVYCGLLNAPVSTHISELLFTLVRVVSFDVASTFIDQDIPSVTNSTLGPDEVSYSIIELDFEANLLDQLKGILTFAILTVVIVLMPWPRT
jgi:hypothetical protein